MLSREERIRAFCYSRTEWCCVSTKEHRIEHRRVTKPCSQKLIWPPWHSFNRPVQSLRLLDAFKQKSKPCNFIHLTVRTGGFRARLPFLAVQNLAVHCLLRLAFINQHVKAILLGLRKAVLHRSPSVAITGQRSFGKLRTPLSFAFQNPSRKVRKKRGKPVPPMSQANLQAQCPPGSLYSVQKAPKPATKHLVLVANEITDIVRYKPFNVLLPNFSPYSVHLSKNTVTGYVLEAPARILTVNSLEPHPFQSKEEGLNVKLIDSSDEESSQNPDGVLEQ